MDKRHGKRTVEDAGHRRTVEDAGHRRTVEDADHRRTVEDAGPYSTEFCSVEVRIYVQKIL
ncbi:MAG: hypothetical protein E7605_03385 [Ruminococcaceae bacterium]|nr:hypothetical protein [Oscillospiraceae bacterium]